MTELVERVARIFNPHTETIGGRAIAEFDARAAITEIFNWLATPSEEAAEAAVDEVVVGCCNHTTGTAAETWQAMLAVRRKEAGA